MNFKSGRFGSAAIAGTAARRLAVDSLQNIANLHADDVDVSALEDVLKGTPQPVPIVEIAQRLAWDSARAADALSRAGRSGLLEFSRSGDVTSVKLAD